MNASVGQAHAMDLGPDYPALVSSWTNETIQELEAGLFDGTLPELLERPDIQETVGRQIIKIYQGLAREKLPHHKDLRQNWTSRFISAFQNSLCPPRKLFPARLASKAWPGMDPSPPPIIASHYHGDVALRPDQVLSARGWGNWFAFEDEQLDAFYMDLLVKDALADLASNIRSLRSIETIFLSGFLSSGTEVAWRPEGRGARFEHLMRDVLNERESVAHSASLADDLFQKTDLRVSYPGLDCGGGVRIQVTLTSNPQHHARKIQGIKWLEEFILLTPLELAKRAIQLSSAAPVQNSSLQGFWESMGGERTDELEFAAYLHTLFADALALPHEHPSGPMWILPASLRNFVRAFTKHQAIRALNFINGPQEPSEQNIFPIPAPSDPLPNSPKTEPVTQSPSPVSDDTPESDAPPPIRAWSLTVCYVKNGKFIRKKLKGVPMEYGDPVEWQSPGPIHQWLKEQLQAQKIPFHCIDWITAERKRECESADCLLEHLPLSPEEIDACHPFLLAP